MSVIAIIAVQSMAQEKWAFGQSKTTGWRRETSNEYAGVATCAELIEGVRPQAQAATENEG